MPDSIVVEQVAKTFQSIRAGDVQALQDVDLQVRPGEFVSLVGPSGCGKSTLLKIIGGLLEPTSGQVRIGGNRVDRPRRDVGIMFQTSVLFPWRDILNNVLLPVEIFGLQRNDYESRARELLDLVGLRGFETALPRELSGGMQQRAALSRVLLMDPTVILMDEPFGALDEFTRERLDLELLRIWQERRQTIVFVTHNIMEALFLSDRVVVMGTKPGRVLSVIQSPLARPREIPMMKEPEFAAAVFEARRLLGVDQ